MKITINHSVFHKKWLDVDYGKMVRNQRIIANNYMSHFKRTTWMRSITTFVTYKDEITVEYNFASQMQMKLLLRMYN